MTTEDALLAAIWAAPHDDLPRLVYADWLDETGIPANTARAEFVRLQIEHARLDGIDPRRSELQARGYELLGPHAHAWSPDLPAAYDGSRRSVLLEHRSDAAGWRRGFLELVLTESAISKLVRVPQRSFRHAPLWRMGHVVHASDIRTLLRWRHLDRIAHLNLADPLVSDDWAGTLADNPGLRNVREWSFQGFPFTGPKMARLAAAWADRQLAWASLLQCDVHALALASLVGSPAAVGLRTLRVCSPRERPGAVGAKALTRSPHVRHLEELWLYDCRIRDEGFVALTRWPGLRTVRRLALQLDLLTDESAAALAASPYAVNLRKLELDYNRFHLDAARALADSPNLAGVQSISFYGNPLGRDHAKAVTILRERFGEGLKMDS